MVVVLTAAGCATERSPGVAFYENDYAYSVGKYKELATRKDKNFALYSCNLGEAYLAAVTATGAAGLVSLDYSCLLHLQGLGVAPARNLLFYHLAEILTMSG